MQTKTKFIHTTELKKANPGAPPAPMKMRARNIANNTAAAIPTRAQKSAFERVSSRTERAKSASRARRFMNLPPLHQLHANRRCDTPARALEGSGEFRPSLRDTHRGG